ncbi:MAG: hypothetical protein QXT45_04385 [Candidatus Bilamarchaeaceae archaeon]
MAKTFVDQGLLGTLQPYFVVGDIARISTQTGQYNPLVTAIDGFGNQKLVLDAPSGDLAQVVVVNGEIRPVVGGAVHYRAEFAGDSATVWSANNAYVRRYLFTVPNGGLLLKRIVFRLTTAFGTGSGILTLGDDNDEDFFQGISFDVGSDQTNGVVSIIDHWQQYPNFSGDVYAYWPASFISSSGLLLIYFEMCFNLTYSNGLFY